MPKHKHVHTECEHEIKYCKKCDECYCDKCGKNWPEKVIIEKPVGSTFTWPKQPSVKYEDSFIEAISKHSHLER